MKPLLVVVLIVVASAGAARAERLTVAVSTPEVKIDSNFTGIDVTTFGVIERDPGAAATDRNYHVAIVVVGPADSVVARRKERLFGIWANRGAQTILRPPSFYSLSASDPIDQLASPGVLQRLEIGFDNVAFVYAGLGTVNDPEASDFRDAYIRLKQRAGLFNQDVGVKFIGGLIFRATTRLPANTPVGHYTVIAYLFADGELLANAQESVEVSTTGFEGTIVSFARSQSLIYGLICAALALFIGWLGGVIFRRD